jgi:hypothetical protein
MYAQVWQPNGINAPKITYANMCPLPQQIPIAETSKASTGCPVQDKINRMGAGEMWGMWEMWADCERRLEVHAKCALPAC